MPTRSWQRSRVDTAVHAFATLVLPFAPPSRREFLPLRRRERPLGPRRNLIGIVVEPLGQAPIGQRVLTRAVGLAAARVGERGAAFALEIRDAARVGFQIDHAAHDQAEHPAFGENPGAGEHAPHRHRAERCEQVADEVGVQAGNPSQDYRFFLFVLLFAKIAFQFSR